MLFQGKDLQNDLDGEQTGTAKSPSVAMTSSRGKVCLSGNGSVILQSKQSINSASHAASETSGCTK